jgi:hypothetical protein
MKRFYFYDSGKMSVIPVSNIFYLKMFGILASWSFLMFLLGSILTKPEVLTLIPKQEIKFLPIGTEAWRDSVFSEQEARAELYLSRFEDTPIEAHMLRLAAENAFDSLGIVVPIELALAQAQMESSMGTKGRSPVRNPFNIGEYDNGTVMWFDSTFDGVQAYYYFIAKNYLRCKSLEQLFKQFTNCKGKRYATEETYEKLIYEQYDFITRYIDNRIGKNSEKNM